jgi:Cu/Ag efflux protein CusF
MSISDYVVRGSYARQAAAAFLLLLLTFSLIFCGGAAEPEADETAEEAQVAPATVEKYAIKGRIVSLHEAEKTAVIEHEEIVGWMSAMTMGFPIRDDADWRKLKVGSQIEGAVFASDDGFYVGEIKVVGEGSE